MVSRINRSTLRLPEVSYIKVGSHVTNIVLYCIFCTSIRTAPVSKSVINFLKLDEISCGNVHITPNFMLQIVICTTVSFIRIVVN